MRRHLVFSIVPLLLIALFSTSCAKDNTPARNQTFDSNIRMLADSKDWLEAIQGISIQYMDLVYESGELDDISHALILGEITEDEARQRGEPVLRRLREAYVGIKLEHDKLSAPPESIQARYWSLYEGQFRYLTVMRDHTGEVLDLSTQVYRAALAGDETVQDKLTIKQFNQLIAILEAENLAIRQQVAGVKSDQPMHPLLHVFLHTNNAISAVFDSISTLIEADPEELPTIDSYTPARAHLLLSQKEIEKGRSLTRANRIQFSNMPTPTTQLKNLQALVLEANDTYDKSFEVEERLVELIEEFSIFLSGSEVMTLSDEDWASFDSDLQTLVNRRMALQQERVALLGKLQ